MKALFANSMAMSQQYKGFMIPFLAQLAAKAGHEVDLAADVFMANKTAFRSHKEWPAYVAGINETTGQRRYDVIYVPIESTITFAALDPDDPARNSIPEKLQSYDTELNAVITASGTGDLVKNALLMGAQCIAVDAALNLFPIQRVETAARELAGGKMWKARALFLGVAA